MYKGRNQRNRSKIAFCELQLRFELPETAVTPYADSTEARMAKRAEELARSLAQLKANPRVRDIRVIVSTDACPACKEVAGTYTKDNVPALPPEGCSCPRGCEGHYQPMLNEIYP